MSSNLFGPQGSGAAGSVGGVKTVSSADYTALSSDEYIEVTTGASNRTITLLNPTTNSGKIFRVKKIDSGAGFVLVQASGSSNFETGSQTYSILNQYDEVTFVSNGTVYKIMGVFLPQNTTTPVGTNLLDRDTAFINDGGGVWQSYADAAGTSPVDGTGGSPTTSISVSTTSPLSGYTSLLYTKPNDSSSHQGEGFSALFPCPSAYYASVLTVEFDYMVASGTFAAGTDSAASDLTVWIYDVTNSTIIPVTPYKLMSSSTTIPGHFKGTFQTSATGSSYRLIVHLGSTTTAAMTVKFDNFRVGPSPAVYGCPATDWTSYSPTLSSSSNVSTSTCWYRRTGDTIHVKGEIVWSGAGGGGTFTVSLPSGMSIDTNKYSTTSIENTVHGWGQWFDNGTARKSVGLIYNDTTTVAFEEWTSSAGSIAGTSFASGDHLSFQFFAPVTGWSSNVLMSNDTDTRVVAARYEASGTTVINTGAAAAIVDFASKIYDTHGAVTTGASWKFTAPVSGLYRVTASAQLDTTSTSNFNGTTEQFELTARKNGTISSVIGHVRPYANQNYPTLSGSTVISCIAGDTIDIRAFQDSGTNWSVGTGATYNYILIERLTGPATIAANELVACRYTNTAGTTLTKSADNTVPFATKDFDTHGAFVTDTFTAPAAGKYRVVAGLLIAAGATWANGDYIQTEIYKNGASHTGTVWPFNTTYSGAIAAGVQGTLNLLAGDAIKIHTNPTKAAAGNVTLNTSAGFNFVCIERIGF